MTLHHITLIQPVPGKAWIGHRNGNRNPQWSSHVSFKRAHLKGDMSVLQCVAVCCSVLQCVAVCCSVTRAHLKGDMSFDH